MTDKHVADVDIRQVDIDRVADFVGALGVTFLHPETPSEAVLSFLQQHWDPARSWGAFAGDHIVGTLRSEPHQLAVPGVDGSTIDITADAVTGVTVAATHRRQGILRRMLTDSLDAAAARGDAVSILIAAEWEIYGRFGYAPAVNWAETVIDRRRAGARLLTAPSGTLRRITNDEALSVLPDVFARSRRSRTGQIDRPPRWWQRHLVRELQRTGSPEYVIIVHDGDDGVDGAVVWHVGSGIELVTGGSITVDDLYAADPAAEHALWAYLLGMDVVDTVTVANRPADDPLPHLLVDGRSVTSKVVDAMWLRLLDVPKALSARRYAIADRLCLDVTDTDVGGFGAGRFTLDGGPDGATCAPDPSASPHLRLTQRALAAVYLGGESLTTWQRAGHVEQFVPGAVGRAERMFRTSVQPWLATGF